MANIKNQKDVSKLFTGLVLKEARKGLPKGITKGVWTYKFQAGQYEVQIPQNEYLPKGFYWYGSAYNSSDAKSKTFESLRSQLNANA